MLEREIEAYLKKKVKLLGGAVRKIKWIGRRGAPDRLVMGDGWHCLIELKRPGKKAEAHQAREHESLRKAGFEVYVLDTKEKIDEVVK